MTNTNDSETKGPERITHTVSRPIMGDYGEYNSITEWQGEYIRADLYTQSQRELEQAKQELAEVKRELDRQVWLNIAYEGKISALTEERDRYRQVLEQVAYEQYRGSDDAMHELHRCIHIAREALNPSDVQASESDDEVTREGG